MALARTSAVVIGTFPLGESDRVVSFFSRGFGKIRGVARSARRMRSRFGGALELFTRGELVFFDSGRSELVQVDHFDILEPFQRLREDLERLGHAAWMVECVSRLTAERDPHARLYGLLVRALRSTHTGAPAQVVAATFGVRCVDLLGHRLRLDRCVGCGRGAIREWRAVGIDVDGGGVVCPRCAEAPGGAVRVSAAGLAALGRLRTAAWDQAVAAPVGAGLADVRTVLDAHVARLSGHPPRASRFLRETAPVFPSGGSG